MGNMLFIARSANAMQDNTKEIRIMRRRGRPRKSETDSSPIRKPKALRLSDEEEKYIANNARKCRINFSEYKRGGKPLITA